ncbi:DUF4403 family protein [Teichococcus wenyumeiae]|uniref:DUF4403 family protein n=1 Tax=Teichococcus wenyumeiae TaxID=2478470 RepID=UPI001F451F88|nr:DUF4403 family protein [Pseudoroseomonas wenyumeiae]
MLIAMLVSGGSWLAEREILLSNEPPRSAATLLLPDQESAIALGLRLPLGQLREVAERTIPINFRQTSEEGANTLYDLTIRRTSGITLSEVDGRLRATVALALNGTVGFGGGLASLLSLDAKAVEAAAEAQVDFRIGLDDGWCPGTQVAVTYRWTRRPRLEIVGGIWIDIEERVRAQVEEALRGLPQQIKSMLPCSEVREQVLALWQPRSITVQLPAAPPLHVSIHPQSVGLSELVVEPRDLRLVLGLRARTSISSAPPAPLPATFLPPLHQLPGDQADRNGRLRLSIPVRAGYDMIRDWLMQEFGRREIPVETPLGPVMLKVRDIFIYPSAPALALAITFDADLPGHWPDVKGRVVLSARPVLSQDGRSIRLTELQFSRSLDSIVWSVVSIAFEQQIRDWLGKVAVYDMKDVMDGAMTELRQRLSDPAFTGGLRVTLTRPSLRLQQVVPENDALTILGAAEAGVEAEITALPLP